MSFIACPACEGGLLKPAHLEHGLLSQICSRCGGCWLYLHDYIHWARRNKQAGTDASGDFELGEADTKQALLCPETKTIMLKFRISKDSDHYLDLSPHAGAVWMDKGEWDLLKHEGLIYKLNSIFSEAWQSKIREGKTRDALEENYIRQFGEQTYVRLKEIRTWLYAQESPHLLLAYLNTVDPYSAGK